MEWLESHVNRINKFCKNLEDGQTIYMHVPNKYTNEYGEKYPGEFDTRQDDRHLARRTHLDERFERLDRYREFLDAKSRTLPVLPVSVIVSDRSSSTSSSVPSPTSSVSDNINNDDRHDVKDRSNDENQDVIVDDEDTNNKAYTYKPLPMVRKSKRQFISSEKKDSLYWERRKRNNEAAKKSRESRREKEIEVNRRCEDLQKENTGMRFTIQNLQDRNAQLEDSLKIYKEILIRNHLI